MTNNQMDRTSRHAISYQNIDLAKFVCALLVVIIHTSPLEHVSTLGNFYLQNVIARIAVPLFFAMSGFLFFGKLDYVDGRIARTHENRARLAKTTRKNLLLYLTWSAFYLLITLSEWYASGWWGWTAVKDWIHAFLFIGSYYHLWYLLALILAIPALYLLLSVIPISQIWTVASDLWILECLTYSYAWIGTTKIPLVAFISTKVPIFFDAMFRAVPLLSIGAILSQKQDKPPRYDVCIATFLLCAVEASVLYFFSPNESSFSYLFSTPFMVWFVLQGLVAWKQVPMSNLQQFCLRDMSISIYCFHPFICWLCKQFSIQPGVPFWLTVTAITVAASYVWTNRNQIRRIL